MLSPTWRQFGEPWVKILRGIDGSHVSCVSAYRFAAVVAVGRARHGPECSSGQLPQSAMNQQSR